MIFRLPETNISGMISDKVLVFGVFLYVVYQTHLISLVFLISSVVSYFLWLNDALSFRKVSIRSYEPGNSLLDSNSPAFEAVNDDVSFLVEMGFAENDAKEALELFNNDKSKAIEYLVQK